MSDRLPSSLRRVVASLLLVTLSSCTPDFGTGGTGELVIPEPQLRNIDPADLAALSTAPPTTQPSPEPATRPVTVPSTLPAAQRPRPALAFLSIERCRQLALEHNLSLRVELLNPTIAREALGAEEARFEALFVGAASFAKSDTATASKLTSAQAESLQIDAGLQIPLRTGGQLNINVPISRQKTNNEFSTLNPAWTSDLVASFTQPLLRGGGFGVTAQPIRVAFYQHQQSQARTKLEVTRVLADVDRIYWRLYAARRVLEVRKQEHDLAVAQLERARREARAGVVADVDIVRAESGVADRLEAIILAEIQVRDRQRELKRYLNAPDLPMEADTIVIPATEPGALFYKLDAARVIEIALVQRMEMIQQELLIAQETSNVALARNATLPLVSLEYTYGINGLGPTAEESIRLATRKDYENHRVGLRIEVPIGNEAARARLRQALAARYQQLATRDQQALLIRQEVLGALDQLEANWQRILAARKRVILARRVLDVETRQFGVGVRTSTDVLDAQTRHADAQSAEIAAVTEYQIAQVDIAFATGTILGLTRVTWDPLAPPRGR